MKNVVVQQTKGNVIVESDGEKQQINVTPPENVDEIDNYHSFLLHDGDKVITAENSYAIDIADDNHAHRTYISLFPNSEVELSISGSKITNIKLLGGLYRVVTYGPIQIPLAEITYLMEVDHYFWINVEDNDKISIAIVSGQAEITHKELGESVKIQMNEQVTLTPTSISDGPEKVNQKFKDAYKKQRAFESNYWKFTAQMGEQIEEGYMEFTKKKYC